MGTVSSADQVLINSYIAKLPKDKQEAFKQLPSDVQISIINQVSLVSMNRSQVNSVFFGQAGDKKFGSDAFGLTIETKDSTVGAQSSESINGSIVSDDTAVSPSSEEPPAAIVDEGGGGGGSEVGTNDTEHPDEIAPENDGEAAEEVVSDEDDTQDVDTNADTGEDNTGDVDTDAGSNDISEGGDDALADNQTVPEGDKTKYTNWVVQYGDTPISLVRKSLAAQGITNPTNEQLNEAMRKFLADNSGKVVKGKDGKFYVKVGQTIILEGEVDTSKNKSKEDTEAEYRAHQQRQERHPEVPKNDEEIKAKNELATYNKRIALARKQGQILAKKIFDDFNGLGAKASYKNDIKKINKFNVIETFTEYEKKNKGITLIQKIGGEVGLSVDERIALITSIKNALIERAKALGINVTSFNSRIDQELKLLKKSFRLMNTEKLDKTIKSLVAEIETKESLNLEKLKDKANGTQNSKNRANVSNEVAQKFAINLLKERLKEAREKLKEGTDSNGWAGSTADFIKGLFGSKNTAKLVKADLDKFEAQIKLLELAQQGKYFKGKKKVSFEEVFEEIFGVKFKKDNVLAYAEAEQEYKIAATAEGMYDEAKMLIPYIEKYDKDPKKTVENITIDDFNKVKYFLSSAGALQKLYKPFADKGINFDSLPVKEQYKLYIACAKDLLSSLKENARKCKNGKTIQELKDRYENTYLAAYGIKNDRIKKAVDYVNSQEVGASIVKGVAVFGATLVTMATCGEGAPLLVGALATMGIGTTLEVADRLTNNIDDSKDLSPEKICELVRNALIDGGMFAATFGLMKLVPKLDAETAMTIVRKIAMEAQEAGIDTGVSMAGDYLKTGKVTLQGTAINMLYSVLGSKISRYGTEAISNAANKLKGGFKLKGEIGVEPPPEVVEADADIKPDGANGQVKIDEQVNPPEVKPEAAPRNEPEVPETGAETNKQTEDRNGQTTLDKVENGPDEFYPNGKPYIKRIKSPGKSEMIVYDEAGNITNHLTETTVTDSKGNITKSLTGMNGEQLYIEHFAETNTMRKHELIAYKNGKPVSRETDIIYSNAKSNISRKLTKEDIVSGESETTLYGKNNEVIGIYSNGTDISALSLKSSPEGRYRVEPDNGPKTQEAPPMHPEEVRPDTGTVDADVKANTGVKEPKVNVEVLSDGSKVIRKINPETGTLEEITLRPDNTYKSVRKFDKSGQLESEVIYKPDGTVESCKGRDFDAIDRKGKNVYTESLPEAEVKPEAAPKNEPKVSEEPRKLPVNPEASSKAGIKPEAQEVASKLSELTKRDGTPLYSQEELDAIIKKVTVENKEVILKLVEIKAKNGDSPYTDYEYLGRIADRVTAKNKDIIIQLAEITNAEDSHIFSRDLDKIAEKLTPVNQDVVLELAKIKNDWGYCTYAEDLEVIADNITAKNRDVILKIIQRENPNGTHPEVMNLDKLAKLITDKNKDIILKIAEIKNPNNTYSYAQKLTGIVEKITSFNKDTIFRLAEIRNQDGTYAFSKNLNKIIDKINIWNKGSILKLANMKNADGNHFLASRLDILAENPRQFLKKFNSLNTEQKNLIGDILANPKCEYLNVDDLLSMNSENLKVIKKYVSMENSTTNELMPLVRILNGDAYFFDTAFNSNYEGLNQIVHGEKPQWMIDEISAFERETGIKLYVDNNVTKEALSENLYIIKNFLESNKIKGVESAPKIYITNFIKKSAGGVYNSGDAIYIRPYSQYANDVSHPNLSAPENKTFFEDALSHENAHYRDNLADGEYESSNIDIQQDSRLKKLISKNIRSYATTNRAEFIACVNEEIEHGRLYVVRNSEGKLVLRRYLTKWNRFTRKELVEIVKLYTEYKGPELKPTAPMITDLKYIEAEIPE